MNNLPDFLLEKHIDPNSPHPLYWQIKQGIDAAINEKLIEHGSVLPSERKLSQHLGVSRATIVKALTMLMNENRIIKKQGKGTVVNLPIQYNLSKGGFSSQLQYRGTVNNRWLVREIINADAMLSRQLVIDIGAPTAHIKRIRLVDNIPICLENTYINIRYLPVPQQLDGSLYRYWRQHNIIPSIHEYELSVHMPSTEEGSMLEIDKLTPLMKIELLTYDQQDNVLEVATIICRSDFYKFKCKVNTDNTAQV